ncbi:hypothetical protein BCJMU51_0943 [Bacillus cereus]|nr:hypothetical protein BCM0045_0969 [Bacillus cereus]BCB98884.1 hypothetical protein BCM0057_0967 [Bacillus cereus]BCC22381.1 hypothetical protein BCM0079_0974 [Bacillus cereus]BCC33988.1 hypothetical protein BCM0105_0978 [Bacillus cereus]BCC39773.1 hypothetical protein BCJMU01_0940 [Bacillus cereus]
MMGMYKETNRVIEKEKGKHRTFLQTFLYSYNFVILQMYSSPFLSLFSLENIVNYEIERYMINFQEVVHETS